MKIISYNVNGIRAAINKGFLEWLEEENPDIICLQEVKALEEQVNIEGFERLGYQVYWHPAKKKGYSGVAVLTKIAPLSLQKGMGIQKYDDEGRLLLLAFEDFTLINSYFPSGSSGDERQEFKYQWLADYQQYIDGIKSAHPRLVLCGDVNICHQPIDIHNPSSNKNTSGFLPEERQWVTDFIASGFIDTFREFCQEPDHYSWWSYRANSRDRNKGWRIDYFFTSSVMKEKLVGAGILPEVKHSDHCPIYILLK